MYYEPLEWLCRFFETRILLAGSAHSRADIAGTALCIFIVLLAGGFPTPADESPKRALQFAADMAKTGNWREAQFRWEALARAQPDNPRILNNLAVAAEALGLPEPAREHYQRALALDPGDTRIESNQLRFERFWSKADSDLGAKLDPKQERKTSGKGKPIKITVQLPVPPRLDLAGARTVLVASFLSDDSALLDINRELVRFLRGKLQKSPLEVLEVTPAPAVPEQTLEDLLENAEFWQHLGREYGADLIVSGIIEYGRRDASGFQDVDRISESTGQKVRSTEFVEQEQFTYRLDVIFMDGASGALRFRDRLQHSAVYRGSQNDPISAFFQISEAMTPDLLAIVTVGSREDPRVVFRK